MDFNKLIDILNKGELAVIPTDTVYGIIGDATNIETIKKVNDIKERKESKPLIILVSDIDMLNKYVLEVNELEKEVIKEYWPGPLTILFPKKEILSDELTAGSKFIGIRLPNNEELIKLIKEFNKPIIATSANITKQEVITSISLLEDSIKNKIKYIYDSGVMQDIASTLIKVEEDKIKILREGIIASKIKEKFKDNIF